MSYTYKAVLRGDRLEWIGEAPEYAPDHPISVQVTVMEEPGDSSSGQKMAEILEKIAEGSDLASLGNPVAWQRKARRDRMLPGRGDGC